MLIMTTLWSRQRSCSISYLLTLQQQACWLLRNQPLLPVLRCVWFHFCSTIICVYVMDTIFSLLLYASLGSNHWRWYAPCSICCCFQWSILGRSWFCCIDGYAINAWFMEQKCWRGKAHGVSSSCFSVSPFFLPSSFSVFCSVVFHWSYHCYVMLNCYSSELVQRVAINDIAESIMAFNTNYKDTGLFGVYAVAKVSVANLWLEVGINYLNYYSIPM